MQGRFAKRTRRTKQVNLPARKKVRVLFQARGLSVGEGDFFRSGGYNPTK